MILTFSVFLLGCKFAIESLYCSRTIFWKDSKVWLFKQLKLLEKTWKAKQNFADNHVDDILRVFLWLSKFSFHHKWKEEWLLVINWNIKVTTRSAKWLKTYDIMKLGNIRKISKLQRLISPCPFLLPKWKFCMC